MHKNSDKQNYVYLSVFISVYATIIISTTMPPSAVVPKPLPAGQKLPAKLLNVARCTRKIKLYRVFISYLNSGFFYIVPSEFNFRQAAYFLTSIP